nr:MAG TPA: hypothetical protein [Caudoviricetes sp.]
MLISIYKHDGRVYYNTCKEILTKKERIKNEN